MTMGLTWRNKTPKYKQVSPGKTVPFRWKSPFMWSFATVIAAASGYYIGEMKVRNEMWTSHLFVEYNPPHSHYSRLVNSREAFLLLNGTGPAGLWDPPEDNGWKPCVEEAAHLSLPKMDTVRYLQVLCGGGLFQLHICVCNAVAVAWLLNSTLVVPYFKEHPFWKDPSKFQDIYDIDHFISYLEHDVRVVTELPFVYEWSTPEYYLNRCLERPNCLTFLPKHATVEWHFQNLLPILESHSVAAVDGLEHKLTFEGLPSFITKLRCRTNFYALQFVQPIQDLGHTLTVRMRTQARARMQPSYPPKALNSSRAPWWSSTYHLLTGRKHLQDNSTMDVHNDGHYIGLHVRFERDMIAHSNCDYGGGRAEQKALASFRYHMWSNRVPKAQYESEYLRRNGSCPLTPEEMGLFLAAFGFRNNTPVYIAGKESYGGRARMKPLKELFPIESKFTLASKQELQPLRQFSHRLTALDFIVLFNSDVFMSNAAGNFPNVLTGYRSFFGPRKSIHPDKAYLSTLFSDTVDWTRFADKAVTAHQKRLGALEQRKVKHSVFRYPAPDCMCQDEKRLPKQRRVDDE